MVALLGVDLPPFECFFLSSFPEIQGVFLLMGMALVFAVVVVVVAVGAAVVLVYCCWIGSPKDAIVLPSFVSPNFDASLVDPNPTTVTMMTVFEEAAPYYLW
jgi:hypothetical protein